MALFNAAGAIVSGPALLTVTLPARIMTPPVAQAVRPGSNVLFSVSATGQGPLRFQWRFNGADLPGATNQSLPLFNVQPAQDGCIVLISDLGGDIVTDPVRLTILVPPLILQHPWNQVVIQGGTATFTVVVSNTATLPLGFRWRRSGVTIGFQILTQYVSHLVLPNVQSNGFYNVGVTNLANSNGIGSLSATLTVLADVDHDGLPDVWEAAYGLSSSNPLDRALDADGDGVSNYDEFVAGTDPMEFP